MNKKISKAFGKKIYLLGINEYNTKYWLEEPKWDCGWYWGFGYIETYTNNNNPLNSKDISSHQHWEGTLQELKQPQYLIGYYERKVEDKYCDLSPRAGFTDENGVRKPYYLYHREYAHNPYDNPYLIEKTFNEKEGWELGELFAQFYFLKEAVEMFGRGKAHVANTTIPLWKDEIKVKEINEILIPKVTERILEILTPEINEMDKNKQ